MNLQEYKRNWAREQKRRDLELLTNGGDPDAVSAAIARREARLEKYRKHRARKKARLEALLAAAKSGDSAAAKLAAELKAAKSAGKRASRIRNAEKVSKTLRLWYQKNLEKHKANVNLWRSENAEAMRAMVANRKARELNAAGRYSAADVRSILAAQGSRCAYCKCRLAAKRHVDHIIPLKLGGSNDKRNLQILCVPCNLHKAAKHPIVFAREIGLLL